LIHDERIISARIMHQPGKNHLAAESAEAAEQNQGFRARIRATQWWITAQFQVFALLSNFAPARTTAVFRTGIDFITSHPV
jgi:hypothetical protein